LGETNPASETTAAVLVDVTQRLRVQERRARDQRSALRRIRGVLSEDALSIVFQPIVELSTGRTVAVEALARFASEPARGPDRWFAEATEVGLNVDLELAALKAALKQLDRLPPDVLMSVNVSLGTVFAEEFGAVIESVPGDHVGIEITEHAPVSDYEALAVALAEPRRRGTTLAVDDAGAGFASLKHILHLAPDVIKLDLGITRGVDSDPARQALAVALIAFASQTGARMVAEGIETEGELRALQDLGVRYGQGYLLARASPLAPPS
jgi:EAL domain-containing protein (putative c-di-GMP-specific phosphodiesterase class I)